MIIDAILYILSWFFIILWSPLSLIPDGSALFGRTGEAFQFFIDRAYGWDFILPVSEALLMFRASIIIIFGLSILYSVWLVWKMIRGS